MKKLSEYKKISILQILTCIVIIIIMWWLNYKKTPSYATDPSLTKELRQANAEQRLALEKRDAEALKSTEYFLRRDSINNIKISEGFSEIKRKQNESNEKINSIRSYNSVELARAFSEFAK